jgi:hypothetical protein
VLAPDGIALLYIARTAYRNLAGLPAEGKRELLGLLISCCTWANGRLAATFHPPFEVFADHLSRTARPAADHCDQPGAAVALKAIFYHPAPGTRRLIARFNAMRRSQGEREWGRTGSSFELEAA